MDYGLTEEQQLIKQSVKEFADEYVAPAAGEIDRNSLYPADTMQKLAEYGYLGLQITEEFKGSEAGFLSFVLSVEELAGVSGSVASIVSNHAKAAYALGKWGTSEQKNEYLGALAEGEKLGAFAVDEPGAACGAGSQKVVAARQADGYILNGQKAYVANGGIADVYVVIALMEETSGAKKAFSAFLVDAKAKGISVGRISSQMGLRGCQVAEIHLDNVFVPVTNRLGAEGQGNKIIAETLAAASIAEGAQVIGITQTALEDAVAYAKQRIQFGRPIATLPAIQNMLAEMAADIHVLRLAVYQAAKLVENQSDFEVQAAIVKLYAGRIGQKILIDVIQVEGGYGYSEEMIASRLYRDVKGVVLKNSSAEFPEKRIAAELLA